MARLTTAARKNIKSSEFAGPGRSFPIEDKDHAEAAERLAPRSEHAGNISASTEKRIVARAKEKVRELGGYSKR